MDFGDLGRIAICFHGAGGALVIIFQGLGEQARSFGDLGLKSSASGGKHPSPPPPWIIKMYLLSC